jgi:hypothetical protein
LLPIVVTLIVATSFVALASYYEWTWAAPVVRHWNRAIPVVRAYVRCSPATFTYLFILAVTTWVLRSSTITVGRQLLFEHSTNLVRLKEDPASVLITSAFWVTPRELWLWIGLFPLVLAPAERWLGSIRATVVFFVGHVGATLVTAATLTFMIRHSWAPDRLRDVIDVGSSYGFWCVAALFTYRLPGRWRWVWAGTIISGAVGFIAWRTSFSDYGHLVAMLIGLGLYPVTREASVRVHEAWPIWRPPALMVDLEIERIETRRRLEHGNEP